MCCAPPWGVPMSFVFSASVLSIEGVDVYWKYDCNRTCSYFGMMYVIPFPFHAVVVFDDTDHYTFLHDPRLFNALESLNLTYHNIPIKHADPKAPTPIPEEK